MRRFHLAAVAAFLLAGCGGAAAPASSPAAPPPSVAASAKPAAASAASAKPAASSPSAAAKPAGSAAPSEARQKVTIAFTAISSITLPLWVAKDAGYLDKYGLDAELTNISSTSKAIPALVGGDVQVVHGIAADGIGAALQGADMVYLSAVTPSAIFSFYVKPNIKTAQDLAGKKIGVSAIGSSGDFATRWYLKRNNMAAGKDVTIVNANSIPGIVTAMSAGAVDGGVISPPTTFTADDAGFHELANLVKDGLHGISGSVVTSRKLLKEKPEIAEAVIKAEIEGIRRIKTDPAYAQQVLGKWAKIDDKRVLEQTVKVTADVLQDRAPLSDESLQSALDETAASGVAVPAGTKAADFRDDSILKKLDQEGFFKSLGV